MRRKHATVARVLSSNPLSISFRSSLVRNNLQCWHRIVSPVLEINLGEQPDKFIGSLDLKGVFTVRSMYAIFNQ